MADSLSPPSSKGAEEIHLASLLAPIQPLLGKIELRLRQEVDSFLPELRPAVQSVLEAGGKRLRPLLAILSGEATGGAREEHILLGTTLEIFHSATLVHDDILDGAEFRRMLPTAKAVLGSEVSVLLGDALFAQALVLASSFPDVDICRTISDAAKRVCSGEILQTFSRKNLELDYDSYLFQIEYKTAALFEVAGELGAYLNVKKSPATAAMKGYGLSMGIAYQLYDDCLDVFGDEDSAGKSLGTDIETGKLTLPILFALRSHNPGLSDKLSGAIIGDRNMTLRELQSLILETDVPGQCKAVIAQYLDQAEHHLEKLPRSNARSILQQLLLYIKQRVHRLLPE
jgi:octaprenyl-diphosphate synthase